MNPDELLRLGANEVRRRLVRVSREIRDEGKHTWALALIKSVESFCRYHGVEIIPDADQVYRMAEHARTLRDRAIILCL